MERKQIASDLRDFAGLLRSRRLHQSTIDRHADELRQALTELRERLPADDTLTDFIGSVLWDCCCLSSVGRAEIIKCSVEGTAELNAKFQLEKADLVRWQNIAQLPTWADASYDQMANGLEVLAEKLTEVQRMVGQQSNDGSGGNAIPTQYRTKAITKQKAASLLRGGNSDSAVEWLNQCIKEKTIFCETLTRQSHVFDVRQFPEAVQGQLLPTASNCR